MGFCRNWFFAVRISWNRAEIGKPEQQLNIVMSGKLMWRDWSDSVEFVKCYLLWQQWWVGCECAFAWAKRSVIKAKWNIFRANSICVILRICSKRTTTEGNIKRGYPVCGNKVNENQLFFYHMHRDNVHWNVQKKVGFRLLCFRILPFLCSKTKLHKNIIFFPNASFFLCVDAHVFMTQHL